MNLTDLILLVILGFAGYRGYRTGFLVSLLSIIAFVAGIVLAFLFLDWGIQVLDEAIEGFNGVIPYMAFIMIFAGVALIVNLLGRFLKKAIDMTILGSFDNIGGGLVGVVKWVLGLSILIWLSHNVGFEIPPNWQRGSILYGRIEPIAPVVIDAVSEYVPFLKSLFDSIAERLQPAVP